MKSLYKSTLTAILTALVTLAVPAMAQSKHSDEARKAAVAKHAQSTSNALGTLSDYTLPNYASAALIPGPVASPTMPAFASKLANPSTNNSTDQGRNK